MHIFDRRRADYIQGRIQDFRLWGVNSRFVLPSLFPFHSFQSLPFCAFLSFPFLPQSQLHPFVQPSPIQQGVWEALWTPQRVWADKVSGTFWVKNHWVPLPINPLLFILKCKYKSLGWDWEISLRGHVCSPGNSFSTQHEQGQQRAITLRAMLDIGVVSYRLTCVRSPLDFQRYFFSSLRNRTKSITATVSGCFFSIALKTCEIGNERRSIIYQA